MKILIDTNIYSYATRDFPFAVEVLRCAESIVISPISVGELISGFKSGKHEKKNRELLGLFLDSPRVQLTQISEMTAEHYANIHQSLRIAGKPIPANDMWIAASAMEHGIPLATMDKHFDGVPGLILVR